MHLFSISAHLNILHDIVSYHITLPSVNKSVSDQL